LGELSPGADALGGGEGKYWEVKEERRKAGKGPTVTIDLLHRATQAKHPDEGFRALSG
jgi:hypothetical protein